MSTHGAGKGDVRICASETDLLREYKTIKSDTLLVEEFIVKKNELCLDGFSINHGKNICIPFQTTYIRTAPGSYGNYMTLEPFNNQKVFNHIQKMLMKSGFNGIFSVEYLIDQNNDLYFLEVNFRNSTWSYAFTYGGVNMLYEWAKATLLGKIDYNALTPRHKPFVAMAEIKDFQDFVLHGDVSVLKWIKDVVTADCLFIWQWRDLGPIYAHAKHLIKKLLKKNFHRKAKTND